MTRDTAAIIFLLTLSAVFVPAVVGGVALMVLLFRQVKRDEAAFEEKRDQLMRRVRT